METTRRGAVVHLAVAAALCFGSPASPVYAWGDEGHEVVALIAKHYLTQAVLAKIDAILATDDSHLTAKDIASEATWADKYRDSDRHTTKKRYDATHDWHFVDLEIAGPDLDAACFGRPALPHGTPATHGPSHDCVVDKIDEFSAELASPATSKTERRLALQFLLHFVGDLHQPLHASDRHDEGGNLVLVTGGGIPDNNLHHDWDTEFVVGLGAGPAAIAATLIGKISAADRKSWSAGATSDWAMETFEVAKTHAYGLLPAPTSPQHYALTPAYVADATRQVAEQLSKAGVRLAVVLNRALK